MSDKYIIKTGMHARISDGRLFPEGLAGYEYAELRYATLVALPEEEKRRNVRAVYLE